MGIKKTLSSAASTETESTVTNVHEQGVDVRPAVQGVSPETPNPRATGETTTETAGYFLKRGHSLSPVVVSSTHLEEADADADDTRCEHVCRVEDIFSSEMNRCSPDLLPELRRKRSSKEGAIICYESSDEDDGEENTESPGLQSRMEALETQRNLLGDDHPDVQFLGRHVMSLRSQKDLLKEALQCNDTLPRSHFIPKSVYLKSPKDYPKQ
jgi:hypothetical protein